MDRVFDALFTPLSFSQQRRSYPPLNISEDDGNIYVESEIPGVPIEDLEITLTNSTLAIKGEKKPVEGKYYRQERASGVFQRVVRLASQVDREKISAKLTDGILTIVLPKSEVMKSKTIAID
jgi:HSP20 family protein